MPTQFDRPAAMFVGESPALDFLNSVATPKATLIDWIDSEANLLDWLEKSGFAKKRNWPVLTMRCKRTRWRRLFRTFVNSEMIFAHLFMRTQGAAKCQTQSL